MLVEQYGEYKCWSSTIFTTHLGTSFGVYYLEVTTPYFRERRLKGRENTCFSTTLSSSFIRSRYKCSPSHQLEQNECHCRNIISQGLWKSSLPSAKKIFSKSKEVLSDPLQSLKRFLNWHTARYFIPKTKRNDMSLFCQLKSFESWSYHSR